MTKFPAAVERLISEFNKLPSIGPKTAQRFVYHLLKQPAYRRHDLIEAIKNLTTAITTCETCLALASTNPCEICSNKNRDRQFICVVAESVDVATLESAGVHRGVYHVLNGLIDPLNDQTPDTLTIEPLLSRLSNQTPPIIEVMLALNQNTEGETTELYLKNLLKDFKLKVTKLARGLPVGADLEYADELTLLNAVKARQEL